VDIEGGEHCAQDFSVFVALFDVENPMKNIGEVANKDIQSSFGSWRVAE